MTSTKVSSGSSRPLVVERTFRVKTIFDSETAEVLSRTAVPLGVSTVRWAVEGEDPMPSPDPIHEERHQVGMWRRMMEAVKMWGLP